MKKIYFLFFISLTLKIFSQPCANVSNIYSFTYAGKNYEVVKELKTWVQAAACAVQRGGHLVHIDTLPENTAVYNAIIGGAGVSSSYTSVNDGGGAAYVWIGATDKNVEGTWLWDGDNDNVGTNFYTGQGNAGAGGGTVIGGAFANWGGAGAGAFDEPDNYQNLQDNGAIALSSWPYGVPGEWNDIKPTNSLYYVIEYESGVGINEKNSSPNKINIFPNPTNSILSFVISEKINSPTNIKINSFEGKLILEKQLQANETSVDVSTLAAGIYFAEFQSSDKEIFRVKFVKE